MRCHAQQKPGVSHVLSKDPRVGCLGASVPRTSVPRRRMVEPEWSHEQPGIVVWRAPTAREFMEALRRSSEHWWEGSGMPWVFRGHAVEAWPLLPSAWRQGNGIIAGSRAEAARRFDRLRPQQSLHWHLPPNFITGVATFGGNDQALQRQLTIDATAELLPVFDWLRGELGTH